MSDPEVLSDLKESRKKKWHELYPILEAADGEVLDGKHRDFVGWHKRERLPDVKTQLDKLAVRWIAHTRRMVSFEERRELMDAMAEELIKTGIAKPNDNPRIPEHLKDRPVVVPHLMELLGIKEYTVVRYLSDKYKRSGSVPRMQVPSKLESQSPKMEATRKRAIMELRGSLLKELSVSELKATKLMYKTNLSWKPLVTHLEFLQGKDLVGYSTDNNTYFLTVKGRKVLTHFQYIEHWLLGPEIKPDIKLEVVENSLKSMYRS